MPTARSRSLAKNNTLHRQHYIEYLVCLINKNNIDPLSIYEGSELIAQLRRMAMDVPERLEDETDAAFYGRCAEVLNLNNQIHQLVPTNSYYMYISRGPRH